MGRKRYITNLAVMIRNMGTMLKISWQTDAKLTLYYYGTTMLGAIAPIIAGLTSKFLIDNVILAQQQGIVTVPLIIALIVAAHYFITGSGSLLRWGMGGVYFDHLLRYKLQNKFNLQFSTKLTELDIAQLEDPKIQDMITITRDAFMWRGPDYLRILSYALANFVSYVASAIALLSFGWWLPVVLTLVVLPRLYLRTKQGALQWSIYGSGAPEARKLWYFGWLLASTEALREIKIFRSQKSLLRRFKEIQDHLFELNKKPLQQYLKISLIGPVIEIIALVVVVLIKIPAVLIGVISVGSLAFLISLVDTLISSATNLGNQVGELYEHNLYINQFLQVMSLPKIIQEVPNPVRLSSRKPPQIEFREVSFQYPNGTDVLHNVSFTIEPGESVALVGVNGAGKSTIVKLLCRFYDVSAGQILIKGTNIRELSLDDWYKQIGTLFQDFVQYHFSVRENIMLGDTTKKDEHLIHEAARRAGAHTFIEKLPAQYDQPLGREFEDGEELSGGQWQKLAIARAFYESAPILIMDEPTSAIDAEAEYEIFNNLEREYKNKTLILVSHRFSTVRNANKILVISKGKLIEQGSHSELMKLGGKYARMFTRQAEGYK